MHYLRAYPTGLGVQIHKVYQEALQAPPRAPLRFAIPVPEKPESQLFGEMPLGDIWQDAQLEPVFEYLYTCKYVRTGLQHACLSCFQVCVVAVETLLARMPCMIGSQLTGLSPCGPSRRSSPWKLLGYPWIRLRLLL